MMDPSDLDSTRVDWTPGLAARRERFSRVETGFQNLVVLQAWKGERTAV